MTAVPEAQTRHTAAKLVVAMSEAIQTLGYILSTQPDEPVGKLAKDTLDRIYQILG